MKATGSLCYSGDYNEGYRFTVADVIQEMKVDRFTVADVILETMMKVAGSL